MSKSIVTIDELLDMWEVDSTVDETEPAKESAKISKLQWKYQKLLSNHSLLVKKLQQDYSAKKKIKWEYYSGDLNNPQDLAEHGLDPVRKKILRQDIPMYIDADPDLIAILSKKIVHEEIVSALTSIIKELNNRTWQLKNIISWEQFIGGR